MDGYDGSFDRMRSTALELDIALQRLAAASIADSDGRCPRDECRAPRVRSMSHTATEMRASSGPRKRRESWSPSLAVHAEDGPAWPPSHDSSPVLYATSSQAGQVQQGGKLLTNGYVAWLLERNSGLTKLKETPTISELESTGSATPSLQRTSVDVSSEIEDECIIINHVDHDPPSPQPGTVTEFLKHTHLPTPTSTISKQARSPSIDSEDDRPLAHSKHARAFFASHRAFVGPPRRYASARPETWPTSTSDALDSLRELPADYPIAYIRGEEHARLREGRRKPWVRRGVLVKPFF
ncbi:hypothetical protein BC830DRAFT_336283 [Chytriomyces sp. MP71]|nr:hypothetical protein BC830DRAFT_336283 [Chytriomyces sp. MP71]